MTELYEVTKLVQERGGGKRAGKRLFTTVQASITSDETASFSTQVLHPIL